MMEIYGNLRWPPNNEALFLGLLSPIPGILPQPLQVEQCSKPALLFH